MDPTLINLLSSLLSQRAAQAYSPTPAPVVPMPTTTRGGARPYVRDITPTIDLGPEGSLEAWQRLREHSLGLDRTGVRTGIVERQPGEPAGNDVATSGMDTPARRAAQGGASPAAPLPSGRSAGEGPPPAIDVGALLRTVGNERELAAGRGTLREGSPGAAAMLQDFPQTLQGDDQQRARQAEAQILATENTLRQYAGGLVQNLQNTSDQNEAAGTFMELTQVVGEIADRRQALRGRPPLDDATRERVIQNSLDRLVTRMMMGGSYEQERRDIEYGRGRSQFAPTFRTGE